jgi:hypothetical protein
MSANIALHQRAIPLCRAVGIMVSWPQIAFVDQSPLHGHLEPLWDIRFFHESESQLNARHALGKAGDSHAILIGNTRGLCHLNRD